jgi:peptidoglycan/xylan/chitin deacetylase (PgdA/CDA1 family)
LILLYHRVNTDGDSFFPSVPVAVFEEQIKYFATHFQVLALGEILDRIRRGIPLKPLTLAITFDDGYRDNYLFAHSVLRKYGLPATVFIATGYIGSKKLMWNDRLAWALKYTNRKHFYICQGGGNGRISIQTKEEKRQSLDRLLNWLKAVPDDEKLELLESVLSSIGNATAEPSDRMLEWVQVREMAQDGWEVGSHTVNHSILTKLQPSRVVAELESSKTVIENMLQRPVDLFAFPNGKESDFNPEVNAAIKNAGYRAAVTTVRGINGLGTDVFELRRCSPWEQHVSSLAAKLTYLYWRGFENGTFKE